jgi:hypothetical protein
MALSHPLEAKKKEYDDIRSFIDGPHGGLVALKNVRRRT